MYPSSNKKCIPLMFQFENRLAISSFLIENKYFDPGTVKGKEFWIYFVE